MIKTKSILLTLFSFLIPFISFAQEPAEKVEVEYNNYISVSIENKTSNQLSLKETTDTIIISNSLDSKIDRIFRPIADNVGQVIFFSLELGSIEDDYKFTLTNSNLKGKLLDFSKIKVQGNKQPENFEFNKNSGLI